ncbi:hypothetical protein B0T25DRAFT_515946 [Lasiosphaeria hispida]|uniref:Uncharacterized protein n=1 Tax=Lasiosphaeria hispida TaxID=260671 RepID=A0AAJ0HSM8_9PEZI|nr:hypothetical protein B0T25DRAFT_515946 [Lasiosphaeria hispida]
MHLPLAPALGVVLALALTVSAENKMPVFQAKVHAPRLTPEYAKLTNNTEIMFEWHEPRMQQHVWRAATRSLAEGPTKTGKKLRKRADFSPRPVGAPLGRGDCAGCANLQAGQDADIFSFDWQYMQTQMITARKNRLKDKCVFYTGLPPDEKIQIQQAKGLLALPEGQSDLATEFACDNDLLTIWNLWPGENDVDPFSNTDNAKPNFWELHAESWLYKLDKSNTGQFDGRDWGAYRGHYFRAMSDAVAHSCSGTVYVMAGKTSMSGYIGIWVDTEYPTLKAKAALPDGNSEKVTKLILVKTLNPEGEQYEMNIDQALPYPTVNRRLKRSDPGYLDLSHFLGDPANITEEALSRRRLDKRNACNANLYWEQADRGDWFGRGF